MIESYIGDSLKMLVENPPSTKVQTWILDPPYNIGFDYGDGFKDRQNDSAYRGWIGSLLHRCYENTQEGGSLFFIHYPEECGRLLPFIDGSGWRLHQWLSWVYPANFGHSKRRFTTAHRTVLWLSKGEPKFNSHATVQPYKNPNDKRIKQHIANGKKGTVFYDWWEINLCKNTSKDHLGYHNQIPYTLLERCILATTDEGDFVGDPCAGSGSTMRAAMLLNRHAWGCDIKVEAKEYWEKWMK